MYDIIVQFTKVYYYLYIQSTSTPPMNIYTLSCPDYNADPSTDQQRINQVEQYVASIVDPSKDQESSITEKIKRRPVHLDTPSVQKRSKKNKRIGQSINVKKISVDAMTMMNRLWMDYIKEVIGNGNDLMARIVKADYHGAKIKVVKSRNPLMVDIEGIVIKENVGSFELGCMTPTRIVNIPKSGNVFLVVLTDALSVHINGNQLMECGGRITRKFKRPKHPL